jgi:hypothetical protein
MPELESAMAKSIEWWLQELRVWVQERLALQESELAWRLPEHERFE